MNLSEENKSIIKAHALDCQPNECCGLIVSQNGKYVAIPLENIDENPSKLFTINPLDFIHFSLTGEIIGVFHSHLDKEGFSDYDKIQADNHKLVYVLYNIKEDSFSIYNSAQKKVNYVGREFEIGKADCYTLVKDYYAQELKIDLPDITHPYRYVYCKSTHEDNGKVHTILEDFFFDNGFERVKSPQKHDILLTKTLNVNSVVHCIIYMGEDFILHHPFGKLSTMEKLNKFWKARTKFIVRHNTLL